VAAIAWGRAQLPAENGSDPADRRNFRSPWARSTGVANAKKIGDLDRNAAALTEIVDQPFLRIGSTFLDGGWGCFGRALCESINCYARLQLWRAVPSNCFSAFS
jgi:hypothetical protein